MINSNHLNNFNILRLLFACMVIFSHAPELRDGNRDNELLTLIFGTVSFGELAVDSFFILSGFLIFKSWESTQKPSTFLTKRILRIYPGFIASAIVCGLLIGPIYGATDYLKDIESIKFSLGLIKLKLQGIPAVFPDTPYPKLNGSMWSIPYEFKCYLLVFIFGFTGLFVRRWLWISLLILCLFIHINNRSGNTDFGNDLLVRCLMAFLSGGCLYLYRDKIKWRLDILMLAILVLLGCLFIKSLAEPAICFLWGYAIIYFALHIKPLTWARTFPDISYGVYLYAWPINKIILWHYPDMNVLFLIGLVLLFSIIAGIISWYLVEKPFMNFKKSIGGKSLEIA